MVSRNVGSAAPSGCPALSAFSNNGRPLPSMSGWTENAFMILAPIQTSRSSRLPGQGRCNQVQQFGLLRVNEEVMSRQHVEREPRRGLPSPGLQRFAAGLVVNAAEDVDGTRQRMSRPIGIGATHQE